MIRKREEYTRIEEQLHQQFNAILDSLCYDASNSAAWYRIGIYLSIKADITRDCIIYERMTNVTEFEHEKFIEDDFSLYVTTSWTNFLLLRTTSFQMENMFAKVGASNEIPCTKDKIKQNDKLIWNKIQAKADEKNYAE